MKRTIIIGGGAAGMAAAISAANCGETVTVLERNRKPLKKLAVTGNGRGNLLNSGTPVYYGDVDFANRVQKKMPCAHVAAFLSTCGIPLVEEAEGRMYPASFQASCAADALRYRAQWAGAKVECGIRATGVERNADGTFTVHGMKGSYAEDTARKSGKVKPGALLREEAVVFEGDRIIVAAGGAAAPVHGTDGSGYDLLTAFGHTLIEPRPALCALLAEVPKGLAGQRVRAKLRLCDGAGQVLASSEGEALFAEDGVSGIAAMQLARHIEQIFCVLHIDLRRAVTGNAEEDTLVWLIRRSSLVEHVDDLLLGAAAPALVAALWRRAGGEPSLGIDALTRLACTINDFALPVLGTRGLDAAQVTAGGIDCADFNPQTMESNLCPGLYAAGEVLNVDGDCGGFNLMFAFATGLIAGRL